VEDKYFLFVIDILIQFELQTHIATFWQKDRQKKKSLCLKKGRKK
jgi:hypothetical protein